MKNKDKLIWAFNILLLIAIVYTVSLNTGFIHKNFPSLLIDRDNSEIKYISLGDSYTIGEGIDKNDNWPNQLVNRLREDGINITLVANPSKTGWTSDNLIRNELPVFLKSKANLVSIQIGVNDYVQRVPAFVFRQNFALILDSVLENVSNERIFVLTIPDFSKTVAGSEYSFGRDVSTDLQVYNEIIMDESRKRNIQVYDIFEMSKNIEVEDMANDGLHYSRKGYSKWIDLFYTDILIRLR